MPELPEVETIVQGLKEKIAGQRISRVTLNLPKIVRSDLKEFLSSLPGQVIERVWRRGKFIIIDLSRDHSLIVHLGMTGQLTYVSSAAPLLKYTHLTLQLENNDLHQLRYRALRQFGYIRLVDSGQLKGVESLAKLGPEPFELTLEQFIHLIGAHRGRIKPLLLDQGVIAGIGNIYADEILYRAQIHPRRPADSLTPLHLKKIYHAMREVLVAAIEKRGSSVQDYVTSDGEAGEYQRLHQVYHRQGQPCFRCGALIAREKLGGRSTHYCPRCQRYIVYTMKGARI
ncbi:bifunctional DNA-formamidopyrimidine glycosylase/DNA-(apurinic or apyrimidinic site) lyase [Candidatus Hakubella thermalkaliphila]|uniref:Formamidopyrimidine-DNA glycosylase n=1 Tax=Candidatus Hakubella thermalkaliphila TaxID=2754717 RepID=A0A6V8PAL3_9ACTN|nr:bifunctional DNA-formamidopyrimidine glycosylase/DNA-(apurinic or apyrimidinic site) lyase [Candidatus Hakubella thermalkaliphila]GFP29722.1 formamidopyrimidine-DNA glycosylase [Candidatus Hakubella thermalkaliphila]